MAARRGAKSSPGHRERASAPAAPCPWNSCLRARSPRYPGRVWSDRARAAACLLEWVTPSDQKEVNRSRRIKRRRCRNHLRRVAGRREGSCGCTSCRWNLLLALRGVLPSACSLHHLGLQIRVEPRGARAFLTRFRAVSSPLRAICSRRNPGDPRKGGGPCGPHTRRGSRIHGPPE